MTVEWPHQTGFVVEEVVGIERFIPNEVIRAPAVISSAAPRDDINDSAAIVAVFGSVVIAEHLDFGDRILIDGHAYLV